MSHTVNTSQKNTSKKAKALLAGGLVLGVGAAVTLASWTDEEWASASFSSGDFGLESSTSTNLSDDSFGPHSEDSAAKLNFELPQASKLGPGEKLAAPLSLRLDAEITHDAKLTLDAATVDQQIQGLTYEAVLINNPQDCTPDAPGEATLVPSAPLGSIPAALPPISLPAGDDKEAGAPVTVCFQVTAAENLAQDQTAAANWTFVGESVTAED